MLGFARAAARRALPVHAGDFTPLAGDFTPLAAVLAGAGGAALGAWAGHLIGRVFPLPLLTGGVVSAAVAGSVIAAHRLAGAPAVGRGAARGALWATLLLALLGQAAGAVLDYRHFRRVTIASLVTGPGAPADPDLYLDVVLLAETGQPGFRGYVLATLGVGRGDPSLASLRLRVLGHLIGLAVTAALAAHVAQASVRAARCRGCRRRVERCACHRRRPGVTDITGTVEARARVDARRGVLTGSPGARILRAP